MRWKSDGLYSLIGKRLEIDGMIYHVTISYYL